MSQISQAEAADLMGKLFTERIPVQALFVSPDGTRISLFGFVDSVTRDVGIVVSVSGPPIDVSRGYFTFIPFDSGCEFWYGEQRELPAELRLSETRGESCLLFHLASAERIALFFTI